MNGKNTSFIADNVEEFKSFEDMNLKENLLRGIISYGYEKPSRIQQLGIVPFTQKRDLIAQAQSGTGKTATFCIAALQNIDDSLKETQCIILAPVRELASQIYYVISSLSHFMNVRVVSILGGEPVEKNIREIKEKSPQILVGTPGRMLHLFEEAYINPNNIKYLIMDEADQMLTQDFKVQVQKIFQLIPSKELYCGLYTATATPEMLQVTDQFMQNPVKVLVQKDELTLDGIKQYYINIEKENWKFDTLMDLYGNLTIYQMMIYCNSKKSAELLKRKLEFHHMPCECIHGRLQFLERNDIMKKFRIGDIRVLITTDLLCRGIDVQQVSLVINYDFPFNIESYIHRIGRTGRYGKKGFAVNFITYNDYDMFKTIEKYYNTQIVEMPSDIKSALSLK
jgi:translation initiation factor 4A